MKLWISFLWQTVHVLIREGGHVLRRALDFSHNCRPKRTWEKQVEKESVKVGFGKGRCTFLFIVECQHKRDCC